MSGRDCDRKFLTKLRSADDAELAKMEKNHQVNLAPEWKRIAIARARNRMLAYLNDQATETFEAEAARAEAMYREMAEQIRRCLGPVLDATMETDRDRTGTESEASC